MQVDDWKDVHKQPPPAMGGPYAVVVRFLCGCAPKGGRAVMTAGRSFSQWAMETEHDVEVTHWTELPPLPRRPDA